MPEAEVERRLLERSFMCAPIDGRNGPVGAHPRKAGALLERWRAQCGRRINYTATGGFAYLPQLTNSGRSAEAASLSLMTMHVSFAAAVQSGTTHRDGPDVR
jgi:hypothetical protein